MQLKPYQEEGVALTVKFLNERGFCYNGSEMGTGKSAMTIRSIDLLPIFHTLVVCQAVGRLVWPKEIEKWRQGKCEYTIASYENVRDRLEEYKKLNFDCLVLDEAQKVKNYKALRTKAIMNHIWTKARYKICLSGTPFTSSILDCWTIFSRMAPEDFGDYWAFAHKYTHVKRGPFGTSFEGIKNADKLKAITRKKFFFRYKLNEADLPPKIWQEIPLDKSYKLDLTPEEEALQKEYVKYLQIAYAQKHAVIKRPPVSAVTKLRQQGLKKVPAIIDFCKNILDQDMPLVIFAYFKESIEKLKDALCKYKPVLITGETDDTGRKSAERAFMDGETNLFIGNIIAAGTSITLTRASTVVFGELAWNPSDVAQASNRCHRIGTTKTVNCYYFTVQDSIDERIINTLVDKAKTFNKVLG